MFFSQLKYSNYIIAHMYRWTQNLMGEIEKNGHRTKNQQNLKKTNTERKY